MGRFSATIGLLAITGVLNLSTAFAADQAGSKDTANRQNVAAGDRNGEAGSIAIPESLRKLNLTDKQKDQIQQIIRDYDRSVDSVWSQFRDRYTQTIKLETSMLAAIEDQLTDTQRQKVRDHRRRTARHLKVTTSTTGDKPHTTAKPDLSGEKPASEIDVDLANVGVALTSEQEANADKVHQQYRTHFKSLNREIHSLHNRLVALESEKLAEIEQALTKDQLNQLRTNRQSSPELPKITLRVDESK